MRGMLCTGLMSVSLAALAQYPLINEVLPADQRTVTDPYGHHPDVIELYNRASVSVNLIGSVIVLGATSQRIMAPLVIPPHGFLVLYCDHHPERGADHLDLKLPRNGGTLLLIDPDHVTVRDVFTWPTLPADVSMGRIRDGAKDWGFFPSPTLGTSNNDALAVHRLLKQPAISVRDGTISCSTEDDATIRYTMDGSTPTTGSAEYTAPVEAAEAHVFNACAFAHDALPSHVTTRTLIDGTDALGISLTK